MEDLKSLKKLFDLCRKSGVKTFKHGEMEFTLNEEFSAPTRKSRTAKKESSEPAVVSDLSITGLTEEQLIAWSSEPLSSAEGQ